MIHIANLTQTLCIPKHFSHYVLTEISETDIHDYPKLLSDWCIKKTPSNYLSNLGSRPIYQNHINEASISN